MKTLVHKGHAYGCPCESEAWRELIQKKKACKCRGKKPAEQFKKFQKMLDHEIKEGEAVLRLKTDLKNKDPSVRDWWIARVVDNPDHPRAGTKSNVWPSYMFQSGIDDHEMGITFILRGQEHSQNQTKQEFLYNYFGWVYPHAVHFGRLKIGEMVLSTSLIKKGIEEGRYSGWDDIQLGTVRALRRRGFKAEALKKIIVDSGLTTSDANISTEKMGAYNKELILDDSIRVTYISDPVKLQIPSHDELEIVKDGKEIIFGRGMHEFFVSESEIKKTKGNVFRLREVYNVKIEQTEGLLLEGKFAGKLADGKTVVPWIHEMMDLELLMPDGKREVGAIEKQDLKKGEYLHLEKKGYCIIDSVDEARPKAWFCH